MDYLFLFPLTIALGSGYISQRADGEITYLTGAIAIICSLLTLVTAPWQIQLVLLVLAIIVIRQFWQKDDIQEMLKIVLPEKARTVDFPEGTVRKYRGVTCDDRLSSATQEPKKLFGKYRGNHWQIAANEHASAPSPNGHLTVRRGLQGAPAGKSPMPPPAGGISEGRGAHSPSRATANPCPPVELKYRGVSINKPGQDTQPDETE